MDDGVGGLVRWVGDCVGAELAAGLQDVSDGGRRRPQVHGDADAGTCTGYYGTGAFGSAEVSVSG